MKHFKFFSFMLALMVSMLLATIALARDTGPLVSSSLNWIQTSKGPQLARFDITPLARIDGKEVYAVSVTTPDFHGSVVQAAPLPPPPTTYNVEAIYDRDSKGVAVGASAFWKRLTHKDKYVDVNFFAGLDKKQIPLAAILVKSTWSPADQVSFSFGPAVEWKQSKLLGVTLFVGISIK